MDEQTEKGRHGKKLFAPYLSIQGHKSETTYLSLASLPSGWYSVTVAMIHPWVTEMFNTYPLTL